MLSKRKLFSISMIFFPLLSLVSCYIEKEENPQEKNFTLDDLTKKYNIKDGELNFGKNRARKILFGRVLIKVQSPPVKCAARNSNRQIPFCVGAFV